MRRHVLALAALLAVTFAPLARAQSIVPAAGCQAGVACQAGSLAVGGAAIGGNALSVSGSIQGSTTVTAAQLASGGANGQGLTFGATGGLYATGTDGSFKFTNTGGTNSFTLTANASSASISSPLAVNGCTIGGNGFCVGGPASVSISQSITNSATANSGSAGATDFAKLVTSPYSNVDAAGAGTSTFWNNVNFGAATLTGTNARTYTNANGLYVAAPVCSTNVTCSSLNAIYAQGGVAVVGNVVSSVNMFAAGLIGTNSNGGKLVLGSATDFILSRPAPWTYQHGDADAAAPVAQTITAQSVVTGTSNTAAPNFTIRAPAGTGTGAGGSLVFQVVPAGTTGTNQNAASTALTIDSTKLATFGGPISVPGNITTTAGGNAFITGSVYSGNSAVASLPTCTGQDGARRFVTDATTTTFASAVVGGGANHVPVYCDGSGTPAWKIG